MTKNNLPATEAMEKPSIPPIQFGKYSIPEPCIEPWETMRPTDEAARHCQRCQKRVFDISGMKPSEMQALEARNGGSICATFFLHNPPLDKEPKSRLRFNLPPWLRYTAAAAATMGIAMVNPPLLKSITWQPRQDQPLPSPDSLYSAPNPLLLSSVLLNQYGENIEDDIVIILTMPDSTQQAITTQAGFFHLYLPDSVTAIDSVTVLVPAQEFHTSLSDRKYPETRFAISVSSPQNATLTLPIVYHYNQMMRGAMMRR